MVIANYCVIVTLNNNNLEMRGWCRDNVGPMATLSKNQCWESVTKSRPWTSRAAKNNRVKFYFHREEDAFMFKLRFM